MNDPITLAATEPEDRDGTPETPDRTDESDGPRHAGATPAAPADETHAEPVRTLLDAAATCRPVEEVTALVSLLKQTGPLSDPGQEALRTAAVTRPVDEVRHMVALLGEPPHGEAEADLTLRAAAVGRPIEDVALLASILGGDEPAAPASPAGDAEPREGPRTPARGAPAAPAADGPRDDPRPALREARADAPRPWPESPPEPRPAPPRTAPRDRPRRDRLPDPRPAPARRAGNALRHLLRWPAAAALLFCGVLHLPGDLAALPALAPADYLPLAVCVLCLGMGALLAVRDTPAVWRAAAVAALAVVALHLAGGIALFDPLEGALGGPHAWAGVTTVLAAGAGSVLAGLALMYRPGPDTAEDPDGA